MAVTHTQFGASRWQKHGLCTRAFLAGIIPVVKLPGSLRDIACCVRWFLPERRISHSQEDEDDDEEDDEEEDDKDEDDELDAEDDELAPGGGVQLNGDIAPAVTVTTDASGKRKSAAAEKPVSKK